MLINQLMRQNRIAILALQETHYSQAQADTLNQLFAGIMKVHVSPDPDSPLAARGVAFALNLRIVKDDMVVLRVLVPGRALSLSLTRRRGTKLTIINAYAPNIMADNASFWRGLAGTADEPGWCQPDVLLGDFNVVENAINRAPARVDPDNAVLALRSLLTKLRLIDGWRERNGTARTFSYVQCSSGSQSRLDRVYVSSSVLRMAHSWDIASSGIPTDHCLVRVDIADYNEPEKGPGRWRLPSFLLSDKKFLDDAQRLGLLAAECQYPDRPDRWPYVDQWRLHDFKDQILHAARTRAKQLTSKLDRRITAIKADI
ncbi:Endonuclease/exonuclease/phosphatase, partial [Cerioporus squamosus]